MSAVPGARLTVSGIGLDLGGRAVLSEVGIVLDVGDSLAVTGPSGSGKSVLCLVLAGVLPPSRGTARLEVPAAGAAGTPEGPRAGLAALILQTHGLVEGLTAEENVAMPLQVRRLDRTEIARRTAQALLDVGLQRHAGRRVEELSGGERQRVGIARALAADPVLLVADEPTAELDPGNRERVLGLLTTHARRGGILVIASDDPEVLGACGRVVILDRGRIVATPSPPSVRR